MRGSRRVLLRVRRWGLIACGAGCLCTGVGIAWRVTRADVIFGVSTGQLALIVGLMVLPGVTLVALIAETRARRSRARAGATGRSPIRQKGAVR